MGKNKKPHYLFCGHLLIKVKVAIYQLEGDLKLDEYYCFNSIGFPGFAVFEKLRKILTRSHLTQPNQPARLQMETPQNVLTRTLFQWHVTIPEKSKWFIEKKSMSASFPSSTVFTRLTTFHGSKCAQCPPAPTKCFQQPHSGYDRYVDIPCSKGAGFR